MKSITIAKLKQSVFTYIVVIAAAVTLARFAVIHYYVDRRYLWGGDQVPIFNYEDLMNSVFSLDIVWKHLGILFVPQMSMVLLSYALKSIVSIFNPNAVFTLNVEGWILNSIIFFIISLTLYYVTSSFRYLNKRHLILAYTLMLVFFAFNPWSTIDTFKSYLGSTSLIAVFGMTLFAYYLRLLNLALNNKPVRRAEVLFITSISLIIATVSPASAIRLFTKLLPIEVAFIVVLIVYIISSTYSPYTHDRPITSLRTVLKIVLLSFIPIAIAGSAIAVYYAIGYFTPLAGRVESLWGGYTPSHKLLYPSYATILNSFKGMSIWIAHSIYMPYRELYEDGFIASLMLLWPIVSLGLPLIMLGRVGSRALWPQVVFLELTAFFALAWGTACNPPLQPLKGLIVNLVPLTPKILPWSTSISYLKFVYIVLTSYVLSLAIVKLLPKLLNMIRCLRMRCLLNILLLVSGIVLVSLLLITALPIFDGRVFGQYFNESIKGFYLPEDYYHLRTLRLDFYEHALVMPATPVYTSTSWGWQGSIAWYHTLNYGLLNRAFAPYISYTRWSEVYDLLTHPLLIPKEAGINLLEFVKVKNIRVLWGGKLLNVSIDASGKLIIKLKAAYNPKHHTDIGIPLVAPLDIKDYSLININMTLQGPKNLTVAPWFMIWSGKVGGVHMFPAVTMPSTVAKTYAVSYPDKPWPASIYYPENITGFIVRLKYLKWGIPDREANITIIINGVVAYNNAELSRQYLEQLRMLGIKYIVVDRSLATYNKYYKLLSNVLDKNFEAVFRGDVVKVYRIFNHTTPITVVSCGTAKALFLSISSTHIALEINGSCSNMLLVMPILYQRGLPIPFRAYIVKEHTQLKLEPLEYKGLLAFKVPNTTGSDKVILTIELSQKYLLLYITYLTLTILPIPLSVVALVLYFKRKVHTYA